MTKRLIFRLVQPLNLCRRARRRKQAPVIWQGPCVAFRPTPEDIADAAVDFVRRDAWGREVLAEAENKRAGNE